MVRHMCWFTSVPTILLQKVQNMCKEFLLYLQICPSPSLKPTFSTSKNLLLQLHIYPPVTGQCQTLTFGPSAHVLIYYYFVQGEIHTCLGVSSDSMFL